MNIPRPPRDVLGATTTPGSVMSDKSPRQSPSKKSGKSIKEKRAIKKAGKATAENDRIGVFLRSGPGAGQSSEKVR